MKAEIYIEGLGRRYIIEDAEQIIWFLEQRSKKYKSKGQITKFWLDFLDRHEGFLLKNQAYELIMMLKSKVTEEQRLNRIKYKLQAQATAALEVAKYEEWKENYQLRVFLTTIKNLN